MSREHQQGCISSRFMSPWLSSSFGSIMRILKASFAILAILIGAAMLIAIGLQRDFGLLTVPQVLISITFVGFGWMWLKEQRVGSRVEYGSELTLTIKLSDAEFGTETERQNILNLKHRLEERLDKEKLGAIDGEEFGGGECNVFIQTDSPTKVRRLVTEFLRSHETTMRYSVTETEL
jgi:hypothetical protein